MLAINLHAEEACPASSALFICWGMRGRTGNRMFVGVVRNRGRGWRWEIYELCILDLIHSVDIHRHEWNSF